MELAYARGQAAAWYGGEIARLEIEAWSQSKANTRQEGDFDVKNDIFGLI